MIGEHQRDPASLLVLDERGQCYALDMRTGTLNPTEISEDWIIDTCDVKHMIRHPLAD